jgi:hypothetical protein
LVPDAAFAVDVFVVLELDGVASPDELFDSPDELFDSEAVPDWEVSDFDPFEPVSVGAELEPESEPARESVR